MIAAWNRLGIRPKLTTILLGLVVVLGAASILQLRSALLVSVGEELDKRAVSVARNVALAVTDPLLTGNALEVRQILNDTVATNPDVRYAFVVNARGALVAHTFTGGFPKDLLTQAKPQERSGEGVLLLASDEGLLHDAAAPIVDGLAGQVRVGITQLHLAASLQVIERWQLVTVALVGSLALLFAYASVFRLTARVQLLTKAAQAVGDGDLTTRVEPGPPDEFGLLARSFNEMIQRLGAAQTALKSKERARTRLLRKVLTAQEEERGRISRELHDEIGQSLTGLIVGLRVLENGPDAVQEHLPTLRRLAAETLETVRHLSRDLRPAVLDDIGLVAALRRYTEDFGRIHSIPGSLEVLGEEGTRLPPAVETTLYRVVQEGLTNIARHSQAKHFGVLLDLRGDPVRVIVEDDGCGFDPNSPRTGIGLAGMVERVRLVGGRLTIESSEGGGTAIFVTVPLEGGDRRAHSDRR